MGLLDDILNKAGDVFGSSEDTAGQIGGELNDSLQGPSDAAADLSVQAEDIVGSIDVPGGLDENLKEILGLGENN